MRNHSAINILIDLAAESSDTLTRQLADRLKSSNQSQEKLNLLMDYRQDYQQRLESTMLRGISPIQHMNFIQFLGKLDSAIEAQQRDLDFRNASLLQTRKDLQVSEKKRLSYEVVGRRADQAADLKSRRMEQKNTDEQATRLASRSTNNRQ